MYNSVTNIPSQVGGLFKPGTHTEVLHSDLRHNQTRDQHVGPLFRPGTHTWVHCSNQGPTRESTVETRDRHVGPLYKPGPQVNVESWRLFVVVHDLWSMSRLRKNPGIRRFCLCILTKDLRLIIWLSNSYSWNGDLLCILFYSHIFTNFNFKEVPFWHDVYLGPRNFSFLIISTF